MQTRSRACNDCSRVYWIFYVFIVLLYRFRRTPPLYSLRINIIISSRSTYEPFSINIINYYREYTQVARSYAPRLEHVLLITAVSIMYYGLGVVRPPTYYARFYECGRARPLLTGFVRHRRRRRKPDPRCAFSKVTNRVGPL